MHSRARLKLWLAIALALIGISSVELANLTSNESTKVESAKEVLAQEVAEEITTLPVPVVTEPVTTTEKVETTTTTTQKTTIATSTTTTSTTTSTTVAPKIDDTGDGNAAPNCSQFELSPHQPVYDKNSLIKKCCPFEEMFEQTKNGQFRCIPGNASVDVETIYAVFYGDSECIEDKENRLHFNYEPNDMCLGSNQTFQYSREQGDQLFVIQNGSLLVLIEDSFMTVFNRYCVEIDGKSRLFAKVCDDEVHRIELKSTAVLIYIGMVLASLTLLFTCLAYAFVPQLNDIFGYLLAGHAGSFLVGLIMVTLAICDDRCIDPDSTAVLLVFAHVFLMSSIYAFFFMNVYNYLYAAYYLPNGMEFEPRGKRDVFISLGVLYIITILPLFLPWRNSLIFHLVLYIYYLAIAVVLYLSHRAIRTLADSKFIRFAVSVQNYTELTYTEALTAQPRINGERLKDLRAVNRLCTVEAIFTVVCWLAYTSMRSHPGSGQDVLRIGAAYAVIFQGLLIGVLFIGGRKKWTIIRECWNYSGSIDLRAVEAEREIVREMKTLDRKTEVPLL
uniref:Probable G-protein coupled receptor Mth-like 14 n=1 Tax=Culex pipiens TaxID=7175 RepID=A0A8D8KF71_CULPI